MLNQRVRAQEHLDTMYSVIAYLIQRCPTAYDDEMDERFQEMLQSFARLTDPSLEKEKNQERLFHDSLGQNYTTALCGLLMRFSNKVIHLSVSNPQLATCTHELRQHMEDLQNQFFADSVANTEMRPE